MVGEGGREGNGGAPEQKVKERALRWGRFLPHLGTFNKSPACSVICLPWLCGGSWKWRYSNLCNANHCSHILLYGILDLTILGFIHIAQSKSELLFKPQPCNCLLQKHDLSCLPTSLRVYFTDSQKFRGGRDLMRASSSGPVKKYFLVSGLKPSRSL